MATSQSPDTLTAESPKQWALKLYNEWCQHAETTSETPLRKYDCLECAEDLFRAAEEAAEERGKALARVDIINSSEYRDAETLEFQLMMRRAKAETVGEAGGVTAWFMDQIRQIEQAMKERCAKEAEALCNYRSPQRCEMENMALGECKGCTIAAAIRALGEGE